MSFVCVLVLCVMGTRVTVWAQGSHVNFTGKELDGFKDTVSHQVGGNTPGVEDVVSQTVQQFLGECHLVVVTSSKHSPVFLQLISHLGAERKPRVVIEAETLFGQDQRTTEQPAVDHLLQGMWGDGRPTCHVLLVHYTDHNTQAVLRLLEWCGVWMRPRTRVLVVGRRSGVAAIFAQPSLRNTVQALYLVLHNHTLQHQPQPQPGKSPEEEVWADVESVYRRCQYCNDGEAGMQQLQFSSLLTTLPVTFQQFYDETEAFQNHTFRVVALDYFPYNDFVRQKSNSPPGSIVTPRDSLDTRMFSVMAAQLNFTYEIREPLDMQWGLPKNDGNWTGIVGTLQREDADFSLIVTLTMEREAVVDFSRVFIDEPLVILSLKPRALPEYLSLIYPFKGEVWIALIVSVVVWGLSLWLLQRAWSWVLGGRYISLNSAFLRSWGIMLANPPTRLTNSITTQVLVGWWLVFCLVVATAYRSSLISHLVVQGKSPLINSVEDLVSRKDWACGTVALDGAIKTFLITSPDPNMREVYNRALFHTKEEGFRLVLAGGYSYIYNIYYAKMEIAARYTDSSGYTPIHISTTQYPLFAGNTWAFREGAPFRRPIDLMMQRFLEAGLIPFWMDDVITTYLVHIRKRKREAGNGEGIKDMLLYNTGNDQVVLGLHHLQVAFYILLLGYTIAFLTFLMEYLCRTEA